MTQYKYPIFVLLFLVQVSCADRARELELRQFKKLSQIRKDVRDIDRIDREMIRIAEEREAERRRIEKEIQDSEKRRIAEERRQERERMRVRNQLVCVRDYASEEACQQQARQYFGDAIAAGGCNAVIQKLSSGDVNWNEAVANGLAEAAAQSDNSVLQLAGQGWKVYSLYKCLANA